MNFTSLTKITAMLLFSLSLAACGGGSGSPGINPSPEPPPSPAALFSHLGLSGATVVDLAKGLGTSEETIVAGTDRGIYFYEGGTSWSLRTPDDWEVIALRGFYSTQLQASVQIGVGTRFLAESLNGGRDWELINTDFGGTEDPQNSEPIRSLEFVSNTGSLFGTGNGVLARSDDFGRHWSVLKGQYGAIASGLSALSVVHERNDVWFGGQGALEDPVMYRFSTETGELTDFSAAVEEHLGRPSTVKNIRFYPGSPDQVYVLGEGGIMTSSDYGTRWAPALTNDNSRFYFDLAIDARTGLIYTGGWDKNFTDPQPLILEVSSDSGLTWSKFPLADTSIQGGVWSVALLEIAGEVRLFLGLQGGGVYEVDLDALEPQL